MAIDNPPIIELNLFDKIRGKKIKKRTTMLIWPSLKSASMAFILEQKKKMKPEKKRTRYFKFSLCFL